MFYRQFLAEYEPEKKNSNIRLLRRVDLSGPLSASILRSFSLVNHRAWVMLEVFVWNPFEQYDVTHRGGWLMRVIPSISKWRLLSLSWQMRSLDNRLRCKIKAHLTCACPETGDKRYKITLLDYQKWNTPTWSCPSLKDIPLSEYNP